jgi:hypothetical protein
LKTGLASIGWYQPQEEAEFDDLLGKLLEQYPGATAVELFLLERLATNWVKSRRLERNDNAMHQKARLFAESLAAERPDNSVASLLPDSDEGRESAAAIMADAATPPVEWTDRVERGRINLERQSLRLIEQIRKSYEPESALGSTAPVRLPGQAEPPADITASTVVPPPAASDSA